MNSGQHSWAYKDREIRRGEAGRGGSVSCGRCGRLRFSLLMIRLSEMNLEFMLEIPASRMNFMVVGLRL